LDIKSNRFKYGKRVLAGCGTQTAALAFGGLPPTTPYTGATEEYNGSTWASSVTGLNTARATYGSRYANSSVSFWWFCTGPNTGATEEYDGSTWTTVTKV
jgi:hypothetical protein